MEFKVPFSLSLEERSLLELYSILNAEFKGENKTWHLEKEESIHQKSVRVTGRIVIKSGEEIITSDTFTGICEDPRPRNVQVSIANIKLLIMCCNSLGLPIDFSYSKVNRGADIVVESWKEMAQNCGMDPVEVSKHRSIKALTRYAKLCNFPIHQALDEAKTAFSSERVTTKQFFEFIFGESNYKSIKSVTRKRKATRVAPVENKKQPEVIVVEEPTQEVLSAPRSAAEVKYLIGKLISQKINSLNFSTLYPELAEKYGNFQYFCIHSSDEEVSRIILDKE